MKINERTNAVASNPVRAGFALLCLLGFGCSSDAQLASSGEAAGNGSCANATHFLYNIFASPVSCTPNEFPFAANSSWTPRENGLCGACSGYVGSHQRPDAHPERNVGGNPPVPASVSISNQVIRITWDAVPATTYQVQYTTNFQGDRSMASMCARPARWMNLTNVHVLGAERPAGVFIPWTNHQNICFRIDRLNTPSLD